MGRGREGVSPGPLPERGARTEADTGTQAYTDIRARPAHVPRQALCNHRAEGKPTRASRPQTAHQSRQAVLYVLLRRFSFELLDGPDSKVGVVGEILSVPGVPGGDGKRVSLRVRRLG